MIYDAIIIGGGIAGATLAYDLANHGAAVLVLERTTRFIDRVRGECLYPWGVTEAQALGLSQHLTRLDVQSVRWWKAYIGDQLTFCRDVPKTTPQRTAILTFYHPELQEALLSAACAAGARVQRGAHAAGINQDTSPSVDIHTGSAITTARARLVVGADGRGSRTRSWRAFRIHHDPERLGIAGVLLQDVAVEEDALHVVNCPPVGHTVIMPLGKRRARAYLTTGIDQTKRTPQRYASLTDFIAGCCAIGAPAEWYQQVKAIGPLASFSGAASCVAQPYQNGVALIGDAAGATDPSWGCGMSLTLRDVRVLRDQLHAQEDWHTAAACYAAARDHYFSALHRLEDWLTTLYYERSPQADRRRDALLPLLAAAPQRIPDLVGLGPDSPSDEAARQRLFGVEPVVQT